MSFDLQGSVAKEGYIMGFMRLETHFGNWYQIETMAGTDFIPCEDLDFDSHITAYLQKKTINCEPESYPVELTILFDRWGSRYSAPGYMDSTEWHIGKFGETEQQVIDSCRAQYGKGEET